MKSVTAFEQRIAELEAHQKALYEALDTAQAERLEAVTKLSAVDPYIDWSAYHKALQEKGK
jgi:hypothetical protein